MKIKTGDGLFLVSDNFEIETELGHFRLKEEDGTLSIKSVSDFPEFGSDIKNLCEEENCHYHILDAAKYIINNTIHKDKEKIKDLEFEEFKKEVLKYKKEKIKLKYPRPISCQKCGNFPEVHKSVYFTDSEIAYIICNQCRIRTKVHSTEQEAIKEWNKMNNAVYYKDEILKNTEKFIESEEFDDSFK